MKKLTYKQVKNFIEIESNSGCKLLSTEYKNYATKMKFKCKCGEIFKTTFGKFKNRNKRQCNKCGKKNASQQRKKLTYDCIRYYVEKFGCELITTKQYFEEYIDNTQKNKIRILCGCGNEFDVTFGNFKNSHTHKHQCNECGKKNGVKKQTKTHDKFTNEVKQLVGSEYTVLGEYINSTTKLKMRHNICKHEYYVSPNGFLNKNNRCPKCFGSIKKTTEQFKKEVYQLVGDRYTVIGNYVNSNTKIEIIHNTCGHKWSVKPNNFLHGTRCPKCANNIKNTTQDFKIKVQEAVGNEYTVLGGYINTHIKIKMRHNCDKCNNHEYDVTPANFLTGFRCPVCNESKGERKIRDMLGSYNQYFNREFSFDDLKGEYDLLRFDFAIFEDKEKTKLKCLIEYDGEFHYKNKFGEQFLKQQQDYDNRKNDYCKEHNTQLIRIPYWEFDNIEEILIKELKLKTYMNNKKIS